MDLEKFAEIVEDMALQHDYPGYDIRSLKMGLPLEVVNSTHKLFKDGLKHENALVRLASLRWFQERPGVAKQYVRVLDYALEDPDEWVRMEATLCLERIGNVDSKIAIHISTLLGDSSIPVRKAAAKALGKLGCRDQVVIDELKKATEDSDHEVRWKAQKALRQLGAYVA